MKILHSYLDFDMKKENILFGIIGLLAGVILGFIVTNNINRNSMMGQNVPSQPNNPQMMSQQQNPGAAMPGVAEALKKADDNPADFDAQVKAGDMFARIKNFGKAIEYYERANKIKPDDYTTIVSLGNLYFDSASSEDSQQWDTGKLQTAQKWYEMAISKKSDDINVRTDLGLTFFLREPKDIDRAIKEYKTSLSINPNHELTLQNLAVAYREKKDTQGLMDTIAKLEKVNPKNPIIQKLKEDNP